MSLRLTLGAALAGAALAAAPTAFAQRANTNAEAIRAAEGMKTDAIMKNAQEVVKDKKPKSEMDKDAAKSMKSEMDKDKKTGMDQKDGAK